MHQSGHSRAHSMQTVQFSSNSPITPRERGGSSGRTSGYCCGDRFTGHRTKGDGKALGQAVTGKGAHEITTLTIPVSAIWARARGMSSVQASFCNWSSRSRG